MADKKKVLAVDDNAVQLDIFKKILSEKYQLNTVNSASGALSFMNSNHVDIILLDIEMPNISGFDFLYDIRKIPSYMNVPIIIVSGNSGAEFYKQAKQSSAFDVLGKPVKSDLLKERMDISEIIGKFKQHQNITVFQSNRYDELLESRTKTALFAGMNPDFIINLFKSIHEESINKQNEVMKYPDG